MIQNYGVLGKLLLVFCLIATACTGITNQELLATNLISGNSADCVSLGLYADITSCQTASFAACTYGFQTLANGTSAICYSPVAGSQSCPVNPASWIYTQWGDWCSNAVAGDFERYRSVISCSSNICSCNTAATIQESCVDVGTCAAIDATFDPTAMPTPSPCP